jgi:dCMP deaminase
MIIINAGIKRVICEKRYHADKDTIELFKKSGVELTVMSKEVENYNNQ